MLEKELCPCCGSPPINQEGCLLSPKCGWGVCSFCKIENAKKVKCLVIRFAFFLLEKLSSPKPRDKWRVKRRLSPPKFLPFCRNIPRHFASNSNAVLAF